MNQKKKIRKNITLSEEAIDVLERQSNGNLSSFIEQLILLYDNFYGRLALDISADIKQYVDVQYKQSIDKFISRTRSIDVSIQVILDYLNSICVENGIKYAAIDKSPSPIYAASRKNLKSRIESNKQRKDWKSE